MEAGESGSGPPASREPFSTSRRTKWSWFSRLASEKKLTADVCHQAQGPRKIAAGKGGVFYLKGQYGYVRLLVSERRLPKLLRMVARTAEPTSRNPKEPWRSLRIRNPGEA